MLLIGSGQGFVKALEQHGSLGICVPAEGGPESHYIRRLRGAGYGVVHMTAKGLGDISASLNRIHGVRPPTLGKSDKRTYYFPGLVQQYQDALPNSQKGIVFWLYEGHILTQQELKTLHAITQQDPRVKVVVEVARARSVKWQPLV
jgi:NAD(P)H-quinone oxidoreductase subunit N